MQPLAALLHAGICQLSCHISRQLLAAVQQACKRCIVACLVLLVQLLHLLEGWRAALALCCPPTLVAIAGCCCCPPFEPGPPGHKCRCVCRGSGCCCRHQLLEPLGQGCVGGKLQAQPPHRVAGDGGGVGWQEGQRDGTVVGDEGAGGAGQPLADGGGSQAGQEGAGDVEAVQASCSGGVEVGEGGCLGVAVAIGVHQVELQLLQLLLPGCCCAALGRVALPAGAPVLLHALNEIKVAAPDHGACALTWGPRLLSQRRETVLNEAALRCRIIGHVDAGQLQRVAAPAEPQADQPAVAGAPIA